MSKQWKWSFALLFLGLLFFCVGLYIVHGMTTPQKGYALAGNPSMEGAIQLAIAWLASVGVTIPAVLKVISALWNRVPLIDPKTGQPKATDKSPSNSDIEPDVIVDLVVAFGEYVQDRNNKPKAMRFWFDLIQFGIDHDPDDETKEWLQKGSEIIRAKFFPPIVLPPPVPVNVVPAVTSGWTYTGPSTPPSMPFVSGIAPANFQSFVTEVPTNPDPLKQQTA